MHEIAPYAEAHGTAFRGGIEANARKIRLGRGYANDGQSFDPDSARYLRPVFDAIQDWDTRIIVVKAAVQTLKTLVAEFFVAYTAEHQPADVIWYDDDDIAALNHYRDRFEPMLHGIPGVSRLLKQVSVDDVTKNGIRLPGMIFRICGLNLGNCQRSSFQIIIIDEAWLAKPGLIGEAVARATQYPTTCKILILSQGGVEGDDFDHRWLDSNQGVLSVKCLACGAAQPWLWSQIRDDKFRDETKRGTYSGFQVDGEKCRVLGDDLKPFEGPGQWDYDAVARHTSWECHACGHRHADDFETRTRLDATAHYTIKNPNAPAKIKGFTWPQWASPRLSWGDMMVKYLRAKEADRYFGNRQPLIEWTQKVAGLSWNNELGAEVRSMAHEPYDPGAEWPDEWRRVMLVDCQHELQSFWYSVHGVAKNGETRQYARGYISKTLDNDPWDELGQISKKFRVPDQYVFLDAGHQQERLVNEAIKHGHNGTIRGVPVWFCWSLLKGSGLQGFQHKGETFHRIYNKALKLVPDHRPAGVSQAISQVDVEMTSFSKLHVCDMSRRYRDGDNAPKYLTLPETESVSNELSHTAQLHSHVRVIPKATAGRPSIPIWVPRKQGIPDHYWDCLNMLMAVLCIWNIGSGHAVNNAANADAEK